MKKVVLTLCLVLFSISSESRDQIRIVGSSTVYPFTTVVAEQFGNKTEYKTPIVESTGTGGGFKLFCSGFVLKPCFFDPIHVGLVRIRLSVKHGYQRFAIVFIGHI